MNLQQMIQKISDKETQDIQLVYGKYYRKLQEKYPDIQLIKGKDSKLKQIKDQGYEDKLIEILQTDYPELIVKDIIYTDMQKIKIFEKELHLIGGIETENEVNDDIKKFVMRVLLKVPDYFFQCPASSTGKYHPSFSCETNGLSKHVKAAVKIAIDLFEIEVFNFDVRTRGLIIASLLLHDCAKNGFNGSQYTLADHPLLITKFIEDNIELEDFPEEDFLILKSAINSHMGKWNTSYKGNKEILPKPKGKLEYFVHICDYLSSKKYITFNFNEDFEV